MPQKSLDEIFGPSQSVNSLTSENKKTSLEDIFGPNGQNQVTSENYPDQKKGLLEKTAGFFDNTFGKAGDALFGTSARALGDSVGMLGTGIKDLITGDYKKVGTPEYKQDVFSKDFEEMTSSPKKGIGNAVSAYVEGIPFTNVAKKTAVSLGQKILGSGEKLLTKFVPESLITSVKGSKYIKPFLEGSKYMSLYEGADSLKNEDPLSKTVEKTILGGIGGGLVGAGGTLAAKGVGTLAKGVKNIISPDVEAALTKAIKPKVNNAKFSESLKTALPDIQETSKILGQKIENIDQLEEVVKESKKGLWEQFKNLLGPNSKAEIDGNIIADRMIKGVDRRFITQNPEKYRKIIETANTYRRPIPLDEAEEFLQSSNNELHSYYGKNKVQQAVAMGDPEISHVVRENNALREELNKKLSELTGENAGALKKRYGALSNLQSEIVPRKNVIARQNPVSLAEQVGYGRAVGNVLKSAANLQIGDAAAGAADLATTRFLKLKNDPNELIKSAFRKLEKKSSSPYAKAVSKFIPAGYLPEKASLPNQINLPKEGILEGRAKLNIKGEIPSYSGIVKDAKKPTVISGTENSKTSNKKGLSPILDSKLKNNNFSEKTKNYEVPTKNGIQKVDGKPVKIHKDINTFISRDENGNWTVHEESTGRSLTQGGYPNEKSAIEDAKNLVDMVGINNIKKQISKLKASQ